MISYILGNSIFVFFMFIFLVIILGGVVFVSAFLYRKVLFIAEQTEILLELLENFKEHLEKINSADLLYGDPTIMNLVEHSKEIERSVRDFLTTFEFMKNEKIVEETDEENAENESEEPTE